MKFSTVTALAVGLAAALSLSAVSANEATIRDAVKLINPKAEVKSITDFGLTGVKQVVADTSVVYISDDGRFVFSGLMLDMVAKRNLSEEAQSVSRQALLSTIPKNAFISYEPKEVKHRITVFTDVSCGYCQMLHKNMQSYLDKGIAVDYVPFPRGGLESPVFATMQSAWCAKDQKKTLDAAYTGATPPAAKCADPVAAMYQLGDKLGVEGTPAIYDQYGNHMGGYVPADQLLQQLDMHNARKASAKTAAN